MKDDDREILAMRHFEQLSNHEVAAALGISPASAGMRHLRALRRLTAALREYPAWFGGLAARVQTGTQSDAEGGADAEYS